MAQQRKIPSSIEEQVTALWTAVVGFNDHGIAARVERIERLTHELRESTWTRTEHRKYVEEHDIDSKEFRETMRELWKDRQRMHRENVLIIISTLSTLAAIALVLVDLLK